MSLTDLVLKEDVVRYLWRPQRCTGKDSHEAIVRSPHLESPGRILVIFFVEILRFVIVCL